MILKNIKRGLLILLFVQTALVLPGADALTEYRLAMRYFDKGDTASYGDAVTYFKRALDANPYYFNALKGLGTAYFRLDHDDLAVRYLKKALLQQPHHPETNLTLARALMELERADEAKPFIDRVLRQKPRSVMALYTDALYWRKKGRRDLALSRLKTIQRIQPAFHLLWIEMGRIHQKMRRFREAESYFRRATDYSANSPVGYYHLGKYYYDRGQFADAILPLKTALSLDSNRRDAIGLLGKIRFHRKEWDEAKPLFERLVKQQPYSHLYRYSLALVNAELAQTDKNRLEDAVRIFKEALVLKNNDEVIRYAFEEFAIRSLPIRHPARAKLSKHHLEFARIYLQSNQVKRARVAIRRAIRLNPVGVASRRVLAGIYRDLGYREAFLQVLKVIAMLEPNNTHLKDRIEFYQKAVATLPSREEGISQYKTAASIPSVVVFDSFEQYNSRHGYFYIPQVYGAMLRDALHTRDLLRLFRSSTGHTLSSPALARQRALSLGADYYTLGRYIKGELFTIIEVGLYSTANGEKIAQFRSSRRGNRRLFELAVDLADKVSAAVPRIARIVRLKGDRVIINAGRRQGVRKGMEYIAKPGAGFRSRYLSSSGKEATKNLTGRIRIISVDETIAIGEVIQRQSFDSVATYQYVIPAPPAKKKAGAGS